MRSRWLVITVVVAACSSGDPILERPSTVPRTTPTSVTSTSTTAPTSTTTTTSTTLPPTTRTSTTTTTPPPQDLPLDEIIDLSLRDLDVFWTAALPATYAIDYKPVAQIVPYRPSQPGTIPACGGEVPPIEVAEDNAFYCGFDDLVAWDEEGLFPDIYEEFGDFAIALVLAHEWGHAIQQRAGVDGLTIMTELQADCFAGAWTGAIDAGSSALLELKPGDLDAAMGGYLLFRDPPGTPRGDPDAHGSAFDRINAFSEGFDAGTTRCAEYADGSYQVIDIPLTEEDIVTGGNLPVDEVIPLISDDLTAWWEITFPEVFGTPWEPIGGLVPYDPDGSVPVCSGVDDYRFQIFYCAEGDFIAWDDVNLLPGIWESFGDFAVGLVFANEWGHAVQARAGIERAQLLQELQADCLTGAWTGSFLIGDPPSSTTGLGLSAGDLDEGIAAMINLSDPRTQGSAFQRNTFFSEGLVGGPEACV